MILGPVDGLKNVQDGVAFTNPVRRLAMSQQRKQAKLFVASAMLGRQNHVMVMEIRPLHHCGH